MRFTLFFSLFLGFAQAAYAQNAPENRGELIPLENGYFLEIIPAKYVTRTKTPDNIKNRPKEWILIPATYEMINETIVVQDAYSVLDVVPAVRAENGQVIQAAKLSLKEIPAVTREVTRRVVKTPAKPVYMQMPGTWRDQTVREEISEASYILFDDAQVEIARFNAPEDVLAKIAEGG